MIEFSNKLAFNERLLGRKKENKPALVCLAAISLAVFCWVGLGTPLFWLKKINVENAEVYQVLQQGIPAVLLVILGILTVNNLRSNLLGLKRFAPLICFVAYLLISLTWSPISLFEKISIVASMALCISAALSIVSIVGLQKAFLVLLISTSAYVLATRLSFKPDIYQPLENLFFNYGFIALLGMGFIVRLTTFGTSKTQSKFVLFLVLMGFIYLLSYPFFSLSSASADAVSNGWVTFRTNYGLFWNVNLHNRVLQIALLVSLLAFLLVWSGHMKQFELSLCVILLSTVVLAVMIREHSASSGRFMMFGVLVFFLVLLIVHQANHLSRVETKKVVGFLTLVFAAVIFCSIYVGTEIFAFFSDGLVEVSKRRDFISRLDIWASSINQLSSTQFIFGVGLDGFWLGNKKLSSLEPILKNQAHAHNGLVDLILQSGIVSVVLLLSAWIHTAGKLHCSKFVTSGARFGYLSVFYLGSFGLVLMNTFESVILPNTSATLLPFTLLLILLLLPMEIESHNQRCCKNLGHKSGSR